jgi:hypothetical protein
MMGMDAYGSRDTWLAPDQRELVADLRTRTVAQAAFDRGVDRRTIRSRVLAIAGLLESRGLEASDVRALLHQRRGRTVPLSGLNAADRRCAARLFGESDLAGGTSVPRRRIRASFAARGAFSRRAGGQG